MIGAQDPHLKGRAPNAAENTSSSFDAADQEPREPALMRPQSRAHASGIDQTSAFPDRRSLGTVSTAKTIKTKYQEIAGMQEELNTSVDGLTRSPTYSDFPQLLNVHIVDSMVEPPDHCIVLLHDAANNETSLIALAKELRQTMPTSVFVTLRGPQRLSPRNNSYHWADPEYGLNEGFLHASKLILGDVIKDSLNAKCYFQPQSIVVVGHCQGGMAALAAVASWGRIEFGGVVSIGGSMPSGTHSDPSNRAKTPALIVGGPIEGTDRKVLQEIMDSFAHVDNYETTPEATLISPEISKPILGFLAHRLKKEEWTKQAVISFGRLV